VPSKPLSLTVVKPSTTRSLLHLQMGQEVIYLLLAAFAFLSLTLAMAYLEKSRTSAENARVISELRSHLESSEAENRRLRSSIGLLNTELAAKLSLIERVKLLTAENTNLLLHIARLQSELQRLKEELARVSAEAQQALAQQSSKPPIINLKETEGFTFAVGDATVSPDFKAKLIAAIPFFLKEATDAKASVIEVIGHTDELPITGRTSNLDQQLIPFLAASRGERPTAIQLAAADNTGLGMARAAAVAQILMSDKRLAAFQILPMSGAQVINTDDTVSAGANAKEASQRRRIELRARRPNY
jgi:flagellar motor protein MotB